MEVPIYSISKPFLAQAILELGIPLDARIGDYLPELESVYSDRIIGSLLNHRSGLDDYGMLTEYHEAVKAGLGAWPREELLARCAVLGHANLGFQYSNIGYLLLRMLLERQTDLSYFAAVESLVLNPLGIVGFSEWEKCTDVVPGYDPRWVYSGTFLGETDTIATGLAALVQYRANTIGFAAGWHSVPYPDTGFDYPGYNYGFMVDGHPAKSAGHGGGGPGFGLMALVNLQTGASGLKFSSDANFDQATAILELRAELAV